VTRHENITMASGRKKSLDRHIPRFDFRYDTHLFQHQLDGVSWAGEGKKERLATPDFYIRIHISDFEYDISTISTFLMHICKTIVIRSHDLRALAGI
jgi:hypothetical protein